MPHDRSGKIVKEFRVNDIKFKIKLNSVAGVGYSCAAIPEAFLDKMIAKRHFSQFGRIRNFILRPGKYSCTVQYENATDAENAFVNGRNYNGIEFEMELVEDPNPTQKVETLIDPDVQEELDAMDNATRKPTPSAVARLGGEGISSSKSNQFQHVFRYSNADAAPRKPKPDLRQSKLGRGSTNTSQAIPYALPPSTVEAPPAVLSSADKQLKTELESILRKPAFTAEEK